MTADDVNNSPDHGPVPSPPARVCRACGAAGVRNRCGGCRRVYFCDRECQRRVWVAHRDECGAGLGIADAKPQRQGQEAPASDSPSGPDASQTEGAPSSGGLFELLRHKLLGGEASARRPTTKPASIHDMPTLTEPPCPHGDVTFSPSACATSPGMTGDEPNADPEAPRDVAPDLSSSKQAPGTPPKSVTVIVEPTATIITEPTGAKHKKKKKKSKHKKQRSMSLHAPASEPMTTTGAGAGGGRGQKPQRSQSLSAKKHIMWGEVAAREFTRFPGGGGAVPYEGTWALGLGEVVADNVKLGSVLEVEELRQQALAARAQELTKGKRTQVVEGETRQFDYKSGRRNPLFTRLSEKERKKVFTESERLHPEEHHHSPARRKRSTSSERSAPGLDDDVDNAEVIVHDFACVSIEQLDEFAKIRDSRDGACGCSCGDLVKKVSKMNVKRLHAFLAARNVPIKGGHSKPELLALARVVALQEKNCSNQSDCECARNGVECHSRVCVGCAGDCHNPFQAYMYNAEEVESYRKSQLAKWKELETHLHQHQQSVRVA